MVNWIYASYWKSLRNTRTESVFCLRDPLPSVAEVLMLPYLVTKKYFVNPDVKGYKRREEAGAQIYP